MKKFKSHFKFNKQERSGIFFLLTLIIILQGVYFYVKANPSQKKSNVLVDNAMEFKLDSLKKISLQKEAKTIYSFNPNYITDYKGYTLGMSTEEIDRLHAFRKSNQFVNSAEQFQQITKVSDSMLTVLSPLFKFPNWKQKRIEYSSRKNDTPKTTNVYKVLDINSATAEDLKKINGIGDKLSARIVRFRDRLGGFLIDEQLFDVYGLDSEVVHRLLNHYKVLNPPVIQKININTATSKQISSLVYIPYQVANSIVEYRTMNGRINTFDELINVEGFPPEKLERIVLYLSL
ncbi:helix-hairpin-helix domain-containing protein [Flagellimonas sp. HMM57]|uniref:ComEA family DNA-binding protein n=1 Tax=unclassified Flagellimonas TaxID=2644544 RepID=UPI0013D0C12B|nr:MULTISPECIES: helix-hairpin-helix domain-containing protein [unclassified Flagellimonas]UII76611.1 helix-hairpin-helix domain-containing protein [Flagellimonas sp. HMM57]